MAAEWPGATGKQITDIEFVRSQYDSEVRCADDGVRELVGALGDLDLLDDTAVIVLGDHGEELGEHGIYFDHHGLYDSDLHVPLILRWPEKVGAGRTLSSLVQHVDLAPTVLDSAGLDPVQAMDGQSLLPFLEHGKEPDVEPFLLTEECTWMAKWALRGEGWKLILAREPDFYDNPMKELYDLRTDPGECRNLAEELPEKTKEMEERLEAVLAGRMARAGRTVDPVRAHGITLGKKMFG